MSKAPLNEYTTKNVGIRQAKGKFVMVTNPDVVFSPALVAFMAKKQLRQDAFYLASMHFDPQWPEKPKNPKEYLTPLLKRATDERLKKGTVYQNARVPEKEKMIA